MQRSPGHHDAPVAVDIQVHHVDCEQGAIFMDCGVQKLRDTAIQTQSQSRQISRAAMIKTLLSDTDTFNVSQPVEDNKGFAVLQHTRAVICQRRRGQHVILILYLDNLFQPYATSLSGELCTSSSA